MIRADGKPGGSRNTVQYNDAGAFAGAPALAYDRATDATLFQGQANHSASLGPDLIPNADLATDMTGWSGTGWSWSAIDYGGGYVPGGIDHDPIETDYLISDAPIANTDDTVLFHFSIVNQTQGAIEISIQPSPYGGAGDDDKAIITGNGVYSLALHAGSDDSHLVINPQPSGEAAIFDGRIEGLASVRKIIFSDPVIVSALSTGNDGSIRIHLVNLASVALGWLAGRGMSPDAGDNLAIGTGAMEAAWGAGANVGIGSDSLRFGADAQTNIAIGPSALRHGQKAQTSVAVGGQALFYAFQSIDNVAIGNQALLNLTRGGQNVAIGTGAGEALLHGTGNVLIGEFAAGDLVDADYKLRISHYIADPEPLIAGDFVAKTVTIGGDLGFYSDAEGIILTDRTTATRYRLYVDNGVLGIEAV